MSEASKLCSVSELLLDGYDVICPSDRATDMHLLLLAEVAGDAIYDAVCCQILVEGGKAGISKPGD